MKSILLACHLSLLALATQAQILYDTSDLEADVFDERIEIVYFDDIAPAQSGSWNDSVYCRITTESTAQRLAGYASYEGILMLDVEPNSTRLPNGAYKWPCLARYEISKADGYAALSLYKTILDGARIAAPKARIGFYGIPHSAIGPAFQEAGYRFGWATESRADYIEHESIVHEQLTRYTDVVFPSVYWNAKWPGPTKASWQLMIDTSRFTHFGREIIAVASPYNTDCGFLDAASVRFQLEALREFDVDGIAYWLADYDRRPGNVPAYAQQNCHWPSQNSSQLDQARFFIDSQSNQRSHTQFPDSQWLLELREFGNRR